MSFGTDYITKPLREKIEKLQEENKNLKSDLQEEGFVIFSQREDIVKLEKENKQLEGIIERNYHLSGFNDTGMDGCDVTWVIALQKLEAIKSIVDNGLFTNRDKIIKILEVLGE